MDKYNGYGYSEATATATATVKSAKMLSVRASVLLSATCLCIIASGTTSMNANGVTNAHSTADLQPRSSVFQSSPATELRSEVDLIVPTIIRPIVGGYSFLHATADVTVTPTHRIFVASASTDTRAIADVTATKASGLLLASASTDTRAIANLSGGGHSMAASASTDTRSIAKLSGGGHSMAASASIDTSAIAKLAVGLHSMFAGGATNTSALLEIGGFQKEMKASGETATDSTCWLSGISILDLTSDTRGVHLSAIVSEVLNLWGIEGVCHAPDFAIDRAINDVNSALQTVWNQASDRNYWSGETLTLTFSDGESSQNLPNSIQNVVGPCRRADNRRPLAIIGTIGELETFSDTYLDGETADEPLAYHIERMSQAGSDPAKTVLHITPPVSGESVDFLLEVVKEAPRYVKDEIFIDPIIPIPHRYTESLLLPIVRYKASSFWLFINTESKATIDKDYAQAMEAIGLADPLPGKSGDNKEGASA